MRPILVSQVDCHALAYRMECDVLGSPGMLSACECAGIYFLARCTHILSAPLAPLPDDSITVPYSTQQTTICCRQG